MTTDMKSVLSEFAELYMPKGDYRLPAVKLEPDTIRAVMINEVAPADSEDDFYGDNATPEYLASALALFAAAGFAARSAGDLIDAGIYITNAVKSPKCGSAIPRETIGAHAPLLEREIGVFPKLRAVMLMGDVARTAFNMIVKRRTGKNAVPSTPTYKLRRSELYCGDIRVFPSYIMTGGNLMIEKSKSAMIAEDIRGMLSVIAA